MSTHERSQAQIEASRANGARSHGPTTEEGKLKCGAAARRHGFLANSILIVGESKEEFEDALQTAIREFEPQSDSEFALVEEMTVCKWRQYRLWQIAASGLSDSIEAQADNAPELLHRSFSSRAWIAAGQMEQTPTGVRLDRYETRNSRKYLQLRRELAALKAARDNNTPPKERNYP